MSKIGGFKAKQAGDYFESLFSFFAIKAKATVIKLPDGCKRVFYNGKIKLLPMQTPFDYILAKNGKTIFLDCKTIEDSNFSFSKLTTHQVDSLFSLEKKEVLSGYLIYYRKVNKIIFYKASVLKKLKPRESLKEQDGLVLGNNQSIDLDLLFTATPETHGRVTGEAVRLQVV